MMVMDAETEKLVTLALREDFKKTGDVTSNAIFGSERSHALLKCKAAGVLAGSAVFSSVFHILDSSVKIDFDYQDGDALEHGVIAARLQGKTRSILGAERTALNFISFLSGIATKTRQFVNEANRWGTAVILDTRKTLPGFRSLAKAAVRAGGGSNHRAGLYDMVIIKDNHIDAAGSIRAAVERVRKKWRKRFRIEVECRTLSDVREALDAAVDRIMLDNMDPGGLRECLRLVNGRIETEISGGVTLESLRVLVPLGATYISAGALTHSVTALDFSLDVVTE